MKKWIFIVVCSACFAAAISSFHFVETSTKKVIQIKSGASFIADHVSQSDRFVFYRFDGKSGMFMQNDVASVGPITVKSETPLIRIVDRWKDRALEQAGWDMNRRNWFDARIFLFLVSLVVFSAFFKLFQFSTRCFKNKGNHKIETETASPMADEAGNGLEGSLEDSDLKNIALFFLELFKRQNGLEKDAPAYCRMAGSDSSHKMTIFELRVQTARNWVSRRMSVGPLGEETGSKSKCYYAIYDTHMVIKLPPIPVMDMKTYVRTIQKEGKISSHLSPVKCIVPTVSVVMKKVTPLPYQSILNQKEREKQYIRLVEEKPEYQSYLKVGGRYALFMELTHNIFLGRVIDELHVTKDRLGDEIREIPDLAWDQQAFTHRYGLSFLPVFNRLQTLYKRCEAEVHRIAQSGERPQKVHPFQIKNWFLSRIANEELQWLEKDGDAALIERVEEAFDDIFESNRQIVADLRQLLKSRLAEKAFVDNREAIENVASNTLALLCRIREKRIALRDLKPDNLFLDANPNHYPDFLKDSGCFSIGVIDVETAVSLILNKETKIEQPLLGGTPLYATPLHLLKNETLSSFFHPLQTVFYYQDWYATVAILFKAITGKNLFVRAARSFPAALNRLKQCQNRSAPDESTLKAICSSFWSAALADTKTALAVYSTVLHELMLEIPVEMVSQVEAELNREKECLQRVIQRQVGSSPLLKSEKNKLFLIQASAETIQKQELRWENKEGLSAQHRLIAPEMVAFLTKLKQLKKGEKEKTNALRSLSSATCQIPAYILLEAMFQIVYRELYRSVWKMNPPAYTTSRSEETVYENRSLVTTILSEQ